MKDFDKPIETVAQVLYYLNNKKFRGDFVLGYNYFGVDNHTKIYHKWIEDQIQNHSIKKSSNALISDVFQLAVYVDFFSESLLDFGIKILRERFYEFAKLDCLEYIFFFIKNKSHNDSLEEVLCNINNLHKESLRIQTILNLSLINFNKYSPLIFSFLLKCNYPTFFYRVANFFEYFPNNSKEILHKNLLSILNKKSFSHNVKNELENRIKF